MKLNTLTLLVVALTVTGIIAYYTIDLSAHTTRLTEWAYANGLTGLAAAGAVSGSLLPFPVETLFLVFHGRDYTPTEIAFAAAVGITVGGWINYLLGGWMVGFLHLKRGDQRAVELLVDRYGMYGIAAYNLLSPLLPVPYITVFAGIGRMNALKFTAAVFLSAFVRYLAILHLFAYTGITLSIFA